MRPSGEGKILAVRSYDGVKILAAKTRPCSKKAYGKDLVAKAQGKDLVTKKLVARKLMAKILWQKSLW